MIILIMISGARMMHDYHVIIRSIAGVARHCALVAVMKAPSTDSYRSLRSSSISCSWAFNEMPAEMSAQMEIFAELHFE